MASLEETRKEKEEPYSLRYWPKSSICLE